jgi:lathosterol oxidase
MGDQEWKRQAKEMEAILKTVEGDDDRHYSADQKKNL